MISLDVDSALARSRAVDFLESTYRQDVDAIVDHVVVTGDAGMVAARPREYMDASADRVVICPLGPDPVGTADQMCEEVLPALVPTAQR